jgi:hypothetical protein
MNLDFSSAERDPLRPGSAHSRNPHGRRSLRQRHHFDLLPSFANDGHGAAAGVAQPKIAGLP